MFNNMSKRKVNATNIIKLSGATTVLSLGLGASGSYFLQIFNPQYHISTWGCMLFSWSFSHVYILIAGVDSLRQELGLRSPIQIIGNSSRRAFGRKIPINTAEGTSDIFMQTLRLNSGSSAEASEVAQVETITIEYDNIEYTLTMPELEEFIYVAWRRQTQSKNGLSRHYWTKQRRPRLKTLDYNLRIWALMSCEGLILDRSEGRSGRLSVPPKEAIKIVRSIL
jgi:hypothetical protein